jgi:hypothetical protein
MNHYTNGNGCVLSASSPDRCLDSVRSTLWQSPHVRMDHAEHGRTAWTWKSTCAYEGVSGVTIYFFCRLLLRLLQLVLPFASSRIDVLSFGIYGIVVANCRQLSPFVSNHRYRSSGLSLSADRWVSLTHSHAELICAYDGDWSQRSQPQLHRQNTERNAKRNVGRNVDRNVDQLERVTLFNHAYKLQFSLTTVMLTTKLYLAQGTDLPRWGLRFTDDHHLRALSLEGPIRRRLLVRIRRVRSKSALLGGDLYGLCWCTALCSMSIWTMYSHNLSSYSKWLDRPINTFRVIDMTLSTMS